MIRLPEKFIQRMSQTLSGDLEDFLASYDKPPVRGVRANLLKTSPEELKSPAFKAELQEVVDRLRAVNDLTKHFPSELDTEEGGTGYSVIPYT